MRSKEHVTLAVGSIGTGKSEFGRALGAEMITAGDGADSVTRRASFHQAGNIIYIDTAGFEDSNRNISDYDRQQEVFSCLKQKKQSYITTVLWFCDPSTRVKPIFQEQASFISSIAAQDAELGGNIWRNVIIIVKKGSGTDLQGPRVAAQREIEQFMARAQEGAKREGRIPRKPVAVNPPVVRLYIMDLDPDSAEQFSTLPPAERHAKGRYKRSELSDFFNKLTEYHQENHVHIRFLKERCLNCIAIGTDKRLMPKGCHKRGGKVHASGWTRQHKSGAMKHTEGLVDDDNWVQDWLLWQEERKRQEGQSGEVSREELRQKAISVGKYIGGAVGGAFGIAAGGVAGITFGGSVGAWAGAMFGITAGLGVGTDVGGRIGRGVGHALNVVASLAGKRQKRQPLQLMPIPPKIYGCCRRQEGRGGCRHLCCEREKGKEGCEVKWLCCQRVGLEAERCKDVCVLCKEGLDEKPGCSGDFDHITEVIEEEK